MSSQSQDSAMESNSMPSAAEMASPSSNSSGSSSSSYPSDNYNPSTDSSITNLVKNNNLAVENNKSSISSDSDSDSREEDFETAPEKPIGGDPDAETVEEPIEGDYSKGPFVDSLDFSIPKSVLQVENVLDVDDKDNEVVGNPKIGVLGGEKVEEESLMGGIGDLKVVGDEGSGEDVLGDKGLSENAISGELVKESGVSDKNENLNEVLSSMDEGSCMPEKQEMEGAKSKDVEGVEEKKSKMFFYVKHSVDVAEGKEGIEDGQKFTSGGDSVVEAINVNVLESGAAIIGDVEKNKEFEIKGMGVSVDKSVSLDNGFGQISGDAEEPHDLKLVGVAESEKKFEPVTRGKVEDAEVGDVEEKKEFENKGMEVPVHKSASLNNGFDQISGDAEEPVDKLVGVVQSEISGEVESENKAMEVPDDKSASLDNGFDQISVNAEEPVDSKLVGVAESEKTVELVMSDKVEDAEVEPNEQKIDAACMGEDEISNRVGVVETETRDIQDDIKIEAEADSETKRNEPVVEIVADGAKLVPTDRLDGGDGYGTQTVDATAENAQTNAAYGTEHVKNDQTYGEQLEDGVLGKSSLPESAEVNSVSNTKIRGEAEAEEIHQAEEEGEIKGSVTDGETEGMIFGSSEAAKQFLEELEQESGVGSHYLGAESSRDDLQRIDGQIVTDSDEEVDTDEEGDGKELFDSAALAALLKAATGSGSDGGNITITTQDGSRLFSVERPAGLGSSLRSMKPAPRSNHPTLFTPNLTTGEETDNSLSDEDKTKLEKLQQTRVKFLRLVHRLGHSPEDSVAAQVLYRMAIVAGRQTSQLFNIDTAKRTALQLEAEGKNDLNFSLTILVIGKTGVGKSATINAIFGEEKAQINAFEPATTTVKEISGMVDGVNIRVFDSPGLKSSAIEQGFNRKILSSVKKLTKKCPPDIFLYVDRLDAQTRDLNDLPLLRSITSSLGPSIWRSAIVTLTHAASAPPDGPSGSPLSYEVFVAQRSHVVQQSIGQAVGDLRLMNPSLMNPVSLVENHPSCRKNRDGQKVLPNGQSWRPQLLLLCYSMKILSEVSSLSKPQDPFDHRKLFGFRVRSPPLPYLLSWLLQSRTHPKLATDQGGDNGDSDVDLDDMSDSDQEEEEDEYDQLPPFKPLRKSQIAKLSKEQKKAYFDEYDYRVKLLQKKQWREELKRMREMKKGKIGVEDYGYMGDDMNQDNETPAAVPVPLPDMVLPPSFDCDNPAYRYRFLEPTSQFLARPVLDTHGWDHDCGYDGVNLEHTLAVASQFPAAISIQMTKDKKEFNIHLDSSVSAKHGENGSSMAGFDIQNIGKQLAYILRGETKFKNFKKNKTAAGVSFTFLGENVATGIKVEDQIALGKRLILVGSTGTVRSQGDAAYGANLEVRLREADYPIGQDQSSLGLSLVKWRGDLALGANFQSQFSIGRGSKMAVRAGLNNKLSGQISVRTSSSEQLHIALVGIIPVFTAIYKSIFPGVSEKYSIY